MAMPARVPDLDWTVERALALPEDGNRYEVLDGELFVTPSPTWGHQSAIEILFRRIFDYVREHGLGWTKLSLRTSRSHRAGSCNRISSSFRRGPRDLRSTGSR
jgi:Uma2 family endonuclease